jgi:vesicle-fusing ATPase
MDFSGQNLLIKISGIERLVIDTNVDMKEQSWGLVFPDTEVRFYKSPDSQLKLTGSIKSTSNQNAIVKPSFKFEDMGIGGLDEEFSAIFRRAFASRIFPSSLVEKLGIQHVRGVLLFGPPGTGKTLMARQIGKMLNAHEPKIVNGPEVLNKFVGQSEENIRNLFKDAEAEYKANGNESKLHIIIFDELDAICKQRSGSASGGTGVGDSIVNQLLSKMDGVDQLNNILIVGMTNRLDLIDEALLRPGRLEVHMEIGLPTESGRLQILKIHTSKMRDNKALADDVDLLELASLSKNFTGAEINGLIKSATSFAFNRHVKVGTLASIDESSIDNMQINRQDFVQAFSEVQAAFGVNDESFLSCAKFGIIHFSPQIEWIFNDCNLCVKSIRSSTDTGSIVSLLLHGPSGSGKTSIAANVALNSDFPFVKMISPESMIGLTEQARIQEITNIFNNAYKSKISLIIVDCIERLLDYVPIGPRFSNSILQTLQVCIKRIPPNNRSLLVISTTSRRQLLEDLDMADCFTSEVFVPAINSLESVFTVIKETSMFSENDQDFIIAEILRLFSKDSSVSISIKALLNLLSLASQDSENGPNRFIESFSSFVIRQ